MNDQDQWQDVFATCPDTPLADHVLLFAMFAIYLMALQVIHLLKVFLDSLCVRLQPNKRNVVVSILPAQLVVQQS